MGFIDILKSLFGNKSDRDLKQIMPIVDRIKAIYPEIEQLSNDELRGRTTDIRQRLADAVKPQRDQIADIKAQIETTEYEEREPLWAKVDKLEKYPYYSPKKEVTVNGSIESLVDFAEQHGCSYMQLKEANLWLRDSKLDNKGGHSYKVLIPNDK